MGLGLGVRVGVRARVRVRVRVSPSMTSKVETRTLLMKASLHAPTLRGGRIDACKGR